MTSDHGDTEMVSMVSHQVTSASGDQVSQDYANISSLVSHVPQQSNKNNCSNDDSDFEDEENIEDEAVTYTFSFGDNVPVVVSTSTETETEVAEDLPKSGDVAMSNDEFDDITKVIEEPDDIVAVPIESKFVVNFTKDVEEEKVDGDNNEAPGTIKESETEKEETNDRDTSKQEFDDSETKPEQEQQNKTKISTKTKLYNLFFGCFSRMKKNKSTEN